MNSDYYTKYIPAHLKDNTLTTSLKHPKPQLSLRIVSILPPEIATAIVNSASGKSWSRLSASGVHVTVYHDNPLRPQLPFILVP